MDNLISVIVPVYENIEYLDECLRSIFNQSHKNLQIIIVDDGSKEDTKVYLKEMALLDNRVEVHLREHRGVSAARNYGTRCAKGKYISFVDSDDIIAPDMIDTLYKVILKKNVTVSVCGHTVFTNSFMMQPDLGEKKYKVTIYNAADAIVEIVSNNAVGGFLWNKLFDRILFENNEIAESMQVYEDLFFICKLYNNHDYNLGFINKNMYFYRSHNVSTLHTMSKLIDLKGNWIHVDVLNSIQGMYKGNTKVEKLFTITILRACVQGRVMLCGKKEYAKTYASLLDIFKTNRKKISNCELSYLERVKLTFQIYIPLVYIKIHSIYSKIKGKNTDEI